MSTSAIVMMLIGCIGLWGGCGVAIAIAMKHSKRKSLEASEAGDADRAETKADSEKKEA